MAYLNNKKNDNNNNRHDVAAATTATISMLAIAIIVVSSTPPMTIITPVAAATTTTIAATTANNNTTTAATPSSSGLVLSPQPIYQERSPEPNVTPINQTHAILTFTGNGTLTLSNSSTQAPINTTSNGTGIISFTTSSGYAKETIKAANGETATATFFEIVQFTNNPAAKGGGEEGEEGGGGTGIVTAVFQTNSTGILAPLNGVIAAGIDDMTPNGESHITLWRWQSGIISSNSNNSNSTGVAAAPSPTMMQGGPSIDTSTSAVTIATGLPRPPSISPSASY